MRLRRVLVGVAATAVVTVGGCTAYLALTGPPGPKQIANRARGLPGVVSVTAVEEDNGGDPPDQWPWTLVIKQAPKDVSVVMKADATADQIDRVFSVYDHDLSNDDVGSVDVSLEGTHFEIVRNSTASASPVVADFTRAIHTDGAIGYYRDTNETFSVVGIQLEGGHLADVLSAAEPFLPVGSQDALYVYDAGFTLRLDEAVDASRFAAREQLVRDVDHRFPLLGAALTNGDPVALYTQPSDANAVRAYATARARALHAGKVTVLTTAPPPPPPTCAHDGAAYGLVYRCSDGAS